MIHFRRYLAALLVLSGMCGAYSLLVAPWIEPPPITRRAAVDAPPPPARSDQDRADFAALFGPDEWERDASKVKVIETERATLLIQDYLPTPDGHVELRPCTIIFYASTGPKAGDKPRSDAARRPIVMQAPEGAVLQFNQPLDLGRAQMGRLEKGLLPGRVTIFSPPTDPQKRDGLRLTTQRVQFDRNQVFTQNEVEFSYGESFGRGRDLTIALLNETDGPAGSPKSFGGVQSLTLEHIDRLRLVAAGQGLPGDDRKAKSQPAAGQEEPLELTCRGPFTLDVMLRRLYFDNQVEVLRASPKGAPDKLRCERLVLEFGSGKAGGAAQDAKAADKSGADQPLAGKIQRMTALGSPAVLEAPSNGIRASAASMEYSPDTRRITLKSDDENQAKRKVSQVSLQQFEQHFIARDIQYEMADGGRLGRLWAAGPGELRLVQTRGPMKQPIIAHWDRELLIRPDGKNQVISLQGAASVAADPLGRFDADGLHIWVLEVPIDQSAPAESVRQGLPRVNIVPDRLLASGHVRSTSPQLDVDTASLKAWFINLPPAAAEPAPAPVPAPAIQQMPSAPATQPSPPVPATQTPSLAVTGPPTNAGGVVREPNLQKFHVAGETIQMQVIVRGQKLELEDLTIEGLQSIDETRTAEAGQEPIRISGKSLELSRGTTPQATIKVSGQRAEVAGRGVTLAGDTIVVLRGENRAQIDGPGEATLPVPEGGGAEALALAPFGGNSAPNRRPAEFPVAHATRPLQKLNVVWQRGMTFDGQTAKLDGGVECRTAGPTGSQLANSRTLNVTLTQRINFSAARGTDQHAEVAHLHLAGGVLIKNWGLDERGKQLSLDQISVPNLTLDRATGTLHADGPGWVHTVRHGAAGLPGAPNGQPAALPFPQPAGQDAQPLTSIHVAFEHAIEGNLANRRIEFQRQVRTTYAPAYQFTDLTTAERLADLDPRGALMTSDRLAIIDMLQPNERWVEMQATGDVHLEGNGFTVQAATVGYTSNKEVLTVEGDGRADARIWRQPVPGQPPDETSLKKFQYNLRTGEFRGDGFRQMDLRNLPANMRLGLPGAGR